MTVKFFRKKDTDKVAQLHLETLSDIGSQLGFSFLKKFYFLLVSHPEIHDCLAVFENNECLAVLTSTRNLGKTHDILKKLYSLSTILLTVKSVISGKIPPLRIFKRIIFEFSLRRKGDAYPSIITLYVAKKYQRRGIGKTLINRLFQRYKRENIRSVWVDTLAENIQALNFYHRIGFQVKEKFSGAILLEYKLEKRRIIGRLK